MTPASKHLPPWRKLVHKSASLSIQICGILWSVAPPSRNEIRLGGFDPGN